MSGEPLKFDIQDIEIETVTEPVPKRTDPPKKVPPKKKKKPKWVSSRYKKLPPTIVINKTVVRTINTKFLEGKQNKLQVSDSEIGEATMYLLEYYTAIDPQHPALVMMGAVMGLGLKVMELQGGPDAKTD